MMSRGFKDRLTYKATPIQVNVPASAANLGPGFDALGLALELRDIYVAQILDEEVFDVDVTGEGADEIKKDGKHLVIKAMMTLSNLWAANLEVLRYALSMQSLTVVDLDLQQLQLWVDFHWLEVWCFLEII